ncbi:MAG: hypothetical protein WA652_08810, partial [Xanthobacteraceae bacterium]
MPAQECRDVELILVARVMHRALPAVLVEPLGRRAPGIFGDRKLMPPVLTRLGWARHRTSGQPFGRWHSADLSSRDGPILLILLAPPETDRSQSLQQRHTPLLWMVVGPHFAAPGAYFILRRHRKFIEPRHARNPRRR